MCVPASAAVWVWETVSLSDSIQSVEGRIEWIGEWGSFSHTITCAMECDAAVPNSPLIELLFSVNGRYPLYSQPRVMVGAFPDDWLEVGEGGFRGFLTGTEAEVIGGPGDIATVVRWGNDDGACTADDFWCSGATGRWVRQPERVPSPSTLALLAPLLYLTARTARSAKRARTASRA